MINGLVDKLRDGNDLEQIVESIKLQKYLAERLLNEATDRLLENKASYNNVLIGLDAAYFLLAYKYCFAYYKCDLEEIIINLKRKFDELKYSEIAQVQLEKEMNEAEIYIRLHDEDKIIEVCLNKGIHPLSLISELSYELSQKQQ